MPCAVLPLAWPCRVVGLSAQPVLPRRWPRRAVGLSASLASAEQSALLPGRPCRAIGLAAKSVSPRSRPRCEVGLVSDLGFIRRPRRLVCLLVEVMIVARRKFEYDAP